MLETFKDLTANQFEAALCTVDACVTRCPDDVWTGPIAQLTFDQAAFHTLFFADLYLEKSPDTFRDQPFHREHQDFFGDYEELEDRKPQARYDQEPISRYARFCRDKAVRVLAAETADTLQAPSGFGWLKFSRAEVHLYNIRHIQHHAGQLILRLRLNSDVNMPWFKSGWRDN